MKSQISIVHPELQRLAKRIPPITFSRRNLWLWRLMDKMLWIRKIPGDITIENVYIPKHDDISKVRLRIYRLKKSSNSFVPALLWLHGGGFILGTPEQDDPLCIQYVRELGIIVISVDYRYAPEHPFPAGLNDSYSALTWINSNAPQLGIDAHRIAVGGDSAGGGLAAALVQFACDKKEVKPIFQLLVYAMLDDRSAIRTDLLENDYLTWNQKSNRFAWESYLMKECGAIDVPPYSVPARREDLSGLPPTWIGVGTLDLFHEEDVTYAQRLKNCGVPCELHVVPGAFHGFVMAGLQVKVVQDFRNSQIAVMRKYLFP